MSYRVPSSNPSMLSITVVSSALPGLQPNLSHLSWLLAPALLVSEITGSLTLILPSFMFFIDLLLELWQSLSQLHGHYPEIVRDAESFLRSTASGFML